MVRDRRQRSTLKTGSLTSLATHQALDLPRISGSHALSPIVDGRTRRCVTATGAQGRPRHKPKRPLQPHSRTVLTLLTSSPSPGRKDSHNKIDPARPPGASTPFWLSANNPPPRDNEPRRGSPRSLRRHPAAHSHASNVKRQRLGFPSLLRDRTSLSLCRAAHLRALHHNAAFATVTGLYSTLTRLSSLRQLPLTIYS